MELLSLFRAIPRPTAEAGNTTFGVTPVPGLSEHRLGKDALGAPALLVHVAPGSSAKPAPLVLQHLTVQHDVTCRIFGTEGGDAHDESVTLVRCLAGERSLREHFLGIAEVVLRGLGPRPTRADASRAIKRLTDLFRAMEEPGRETIQGLWTELFVLRHAQDPVTLLRAWHGDAEEAFDFADRADRLEVKSSSGPFRIHRFALQQLRPASAARVFVVSVLVEKSGGGVTIAELVRGIRNRIGDHSELTEKMDMVIAQSLGSNISSGLDQGFDVEKAKASVRFFDAATIPSVMPPLPAGVSNVHFDADLEGVQPLDLAASRPWGPLFEAAIPSIP